MKLENADKYTNQELVKIILENGFSPNKESTLLRYPKDKLITIIENEGEEPTTPEAEANKKATANALDSFLNMLDSVKIEKTGTPNKASVKKVFRDNLDGEAFVSEKNSHTLKLIFCIGAGIWLIWDSFNLTKWFKERQTMRQNAKQAENQPA